MKAVAQCKEKTSALHIEISRVNKWMKVSTRRVYLAAAEYDVVSTVVHQHLAHARIYQHAVDTKSVLIEHGQL